MNEYEYQNRKTMLQRDIRYYTSLAEQEPLGSPKQTEYWTKENEARMNLEALEKLKNKRKKKHATRKRTILEKNVGRARKKRTKKNPEEPN